MANVVNQQTLIAGFKSAIVYLTLEYVDTVVTDYLIYDSSAIATSAGGTDTLKSTIIDVTYSISVANALAAALPQVKLEFDATTDVLALALPANHSNKLCFEDIGGLVNNAGTGKTGDILLTATNMAAGDKISIIMKVRRD